jgi:hypothetical protein
MAQLDLFALPAASRAEPTSIAAEARHTASGARQRHIDLVVACVRSRPGLTGAEIGAAVGLELHESRRRCSDARSLGLIVPSGQRVCEITSHTSLTWRATNGN